MNKNTKNVIFKIWNVAIYALFWDKFSKFWKFASVKNWQIWCLCLNCIFYMYPAQASSKLCEFIFNCPEQLNGWPSPMDPPTPLVLVCWEVWTGKFGENVKVEVLKSYFYFVLCQNDSDLGFSSRSIILRAIKSCRASKRYKTSD